MNYEVLALMIDRKTKWDKRFLALAEHISSWSKDPSTKVGAVIVRPDLTIASLGYNGFPRGCDDDIHLYMNRTYKYSRIIHAELNAILSASESLHGYTLYTWPFPPCDRCAGAIIQAGITRIVSCQPTEEQGERWGESFRNALLLTDEVRIKMELYS